MTNREYIEKKLAALGISEATLADLSLTVDLDAEYTGSEQVGVALVGAIEELILAPRLRSVSESGFSMSWDTDNLARWYLWLCRRYAVRPNDDALSLLGVSMVRDISDRW